SARREFYNFRIDFIAAKGVSRLSIGSKCANAQTNNSNPEASCPYTSKTARVVEQGQADSALATIIGGWEVTFVFSLVLQSVSYPSVPEPEQVVGGVIGILLFDCQHSIEIPTDPHGTYQ